MAWACVLQWDGLTHTEAALHVDYREQLRILTSASASRSVRVTTRIPWDLVTLEGRGRSLASATATISKDGIDVISGPIGDMKPGARWEPFTFTIRAALDQDDAIIPTQASSEHASTGAANAALGGSSSTRWARRAPVVNAVTFPLAAASAYGLTYPQAFGSPGMLASFGGVLPGTLMTDPRFFYASPAYLVDVVDSELLLAGHLTNLVTIQ